MTSVVDLELTGHERSLGDGLTVRRVLPSTTRKTVGPFIFFDHMGPATFAPGHGIDVRPHPHINLATVTYLFAGALLHKDSIGSEQLIEPGAVNWMTAGRGIVHSERTPPPARKAGALVHGLQLWVALPTSAEECAPSFSHHASSSIPELSPGRDVTARVIAGAAYGERSPVITASPLVYLELHMKAGGGAAFPDESRSMQRAAYVVDGSARIAGRDYSAGTMVIFSDGAHASVSANTDAHVMFLGGDALDGERFISWNFVSSTRERIDAAASAWRARDTGAFPLVPGDDVEFIPLPDALGRPR